MEEYNFPVYRRYSDGKTLFKILSLLEFEEVKRVGNAVKHSKIKAELYPEKVRILDMLSNAGGFWEEGSEIEWNAFMKS